MAQEHVGGFVKERLLREMDAGFSELMAVARALPRLAPSRDGRWGSFETLSHMVGWHLSAAARLQQMARDEQPAHPGPDDEVNAVFVAERAGLSADELLAQLESSFRELRGAVEDVNAAAFWLSGRGEEDSLAYFIAYANGPEHYREHAQDLKK